ncbi:SURF1 family protein [Marinobacterium sedimentorum]|uniref:SURF1 family protein n=1 Tax=Marinobacterium sedimentorum TaxID=2927804 RepID=UPI0020C65DC0|nr:SURF1 family protein [Marinobacterium sedimentorum]MCP8688472.1 SURF1 family protein [Marinobacterium sedimentorum]
MSKGDRRSGFKWLLILSAVLLLPLLLYLGSWQLDRAAEKEQLLHAWNDDSVLVTNLSQLHDLGDRSLMQARLEGELLPGQWLLLDNRTRGGQVGYELIGLLQTPQGSALLPVNLGWLQASPDRSRLPVIALPELPESFSGRMHRIEPAFVLAQDAWSQGWPLRVQTLDVDRLESVMQRPVLPWVLEVVEPVDKRLTTDWPLASLKPERHLGYAVQWFAMAIALFILLLWQWRNRLSKGVND